MDFKIAFAVNYDPQHVISIRIQVNNNKSFEHQEVEGLDEKSNWLDYPSPMENVEVSQENPLAVVKAKEVSTPIVINSKVSGKRNFSDAMET